jgi:hypothetical protein
MSRKLLRIHCDSLDYLFLVSFQLMPGSKFSIPKRTEASVPSSIYTLGLSPYKYYGSYFHCYHGNATTEITGVFHVKKTTEDSPSQSQLCLPRFLSAYARQQVLHHYKTSIDHGADIGAVSKKPKAPAKSNINVLTSVATMASLFCSICVRALASQ